LWLDEVLVPCEKVFAHSFEGPSPEENRVRDRIFCWLTWHHQHSYLAHADFTLGLALAITECMGGKENANMVAKLVDMMIDVSTIRSCLSAANYEAVTSDGGFLLPKPMHVATATIHTLKTRQKMAEILRDIPGSSLVIRPTKSDFDDPEMAEALERGFGGGRYSGKQRAALLNLVWDQVSSGLDGRESAFELHASGGMALWRSRVQRWFDRSNTLANKALRTLDIEMPDVDMASLRDISPFRQGGTPQAVQAPAPAK
jgi:aromatic ring hydroxylase